MLYVNHWCMKPFTESINDIFTVASLTNPFWLEESEQDCGGAETSRLGGHNDLSFVIFGRTHTANYLACRHPFGGQQTVMTADRETWGKREREGDQGERYRRREVKPVSIRRLSQTVNRGSEFKSGLSRVWVAMTFRPFTQLLSSRGC